MSDPEPRATATTARKPVKIILVGSGGVGKTCIASRLATGTYIDSTMTIGLNVESWTMMDDDDQMRKVVSVDLGGQKQFHFMHEAFTRGAKMVIAVFDVTRYESLLDLEYWEDLIFELPDKKCILLGNKCDLGCEIPDVEIEELEEKWKTSCIHVSAKTGENFQDLEKSILLGINKV